MKCLSMAVWTIVVVLVLGAAGCASKHDAYSIKLNLDPESFRNAETGQHLSFEVDVYATNESEAARWATLSAEEYFAATNALRQDLNVYTATFTHRDLKPKTLSRRSVYWKDWKRKGATRLFIVAHLPELAGESPEAARARKLLELPLDRKAWPNGFFTPRTRSLNVLVQRSGLVCLTSQKRQNPQP